MFITFEGPEGGGKSTLIKAVASSLEAVGKTILVTREPGSGQVGAEIRKILLHQEALDARAELFLFLADRAHHVAKEIKPALKSSVWVLCDRYADSTIVYQGYGRGLNLEHLRNWNDYATDGLKPDVTFLLDLPPEVGLARIQDKDRLDQEPLEFHQKIRNGFLEEARREPERWVTLDASQSPEEVTAKAILALENRAQQLKTR